MSEVLFPGRLPEGVQRILSLLAPTVDGKMLTMRDSQGELRGLIVGSVLHLEDHRFPEVRRVTVKKVSDLVAALLNLPPAVSESGTLLTHAGLFEYRIDPDGAVLLNLQPHVPEALVVGGVTYRHIGGYTYMERGTLLTRTVCNTQDSYRDGNRPTAAAKLLRMIGQAAFHALPSPYTRALARLRDTRSKLSTAEKALRQAQEAYDALLTQMREAQTEAATHTPSSAPGHAEAAA